MITTHSHSLVIANQIYIFQWECLSDFRIREIMLKLGNRDSVALFMAYVEAIANFESVKQLWIQISRASSKPSHNTGFSAQCALQEVEVHRL